MAIKKLQKQEQEQKPEELHDFYDAYFSGEVKIKFNKLKVLKLLKRLGYYWFMPPKQGNIGGERKLARQGMIVRIVDNKIRIVDDVEVQYAFIDYIRKLPSIQKEFQKKVIEDGQVTLEPFEYTITPTLLEEKTLNNISNLFNGDMMFHLRPSDEDPAILIQDDTIDEKYIYFNNTVAKISKGGVEYIPYKNLNGYIWENNILYRNFEYTEEIGDYEVFINDICGYDPENTNADMRAKGRARKKSLMSILGYLMHNNYETDRKALIFTDVNDEDTSEANGRTGKGLLGKALRAIINRNEDDCRYLQVPGKDFEFKDTRYSGGDLSTQLIHIEDIDTKKFDFEQFFNDVTDGCKFRKLHQNPTIHNAKLMISTNHTVNIMGSNSKMGRAVVFELENYYSATFTPSMKFKRLFFGTRWEDRDWMQFYSFMVRCAAEYMKNGLIMPDMINYVNRVIEENLPEDFIYYFDHQIQVNVALKRRQELDKRALFNGFVGKYPELAKYQQGFTKWITMYLKLKKIPSAHLRTSRNNDYTDLLVIFPSDGEKVHKWIYKKGIEGEEKQTN